MDTPTILYDRFERVDLGNLNYKNFNISYFDFPKINEPLHDLYIFLNASLNTNLLKELFNLLAWFSLLQDTNVWWSQRVRRFQLSMTMIFDIDINLWNKVVPQLEITDFFEKIFFFKIFRSTAIDHLLIMWGSIILFFYMLYVNTYFYYYENIEIFFFLL